MLRLGSCPKSYALDQDKVVSPADTVARVQACLEKLFPGVLAKIDRVDTGRLGIPVYVSECGPDARAVMPTRKQMGKGATPDQARASALMELVERYSFFHFWESEAFTQLTWSEAEEQWPEQLLPLEQMLQSVDETLAPEQARTVLDLVEWRFCPALDVATGRDVVVPLDWFKKLNEFNGASAGNSPEESILQGACELVERHVCALVDRERPELPTIDPSDSEDTVLRELVDAFERNGVRVLLKDFSLGMPVPTVAAVAWDPSTFPGMSEIVFTAGTSSSPVKAAVRALTEVAQLAGDFSTGRIYEASGLPKFTSLDQFDWLRRGPVVSLRELPDVEHDDIYEELLTLARKLNAQGYALYSVATTPPGMEAAANYNVVPGFAFRERTAHASLGLFVGRSLAEEAPEAQAVVGLEMLAEVYPDAHFVPVFKGLLALRLEDPEEAVRCFALAEPLQPAPGEQALAAFYRAYALSRLERWDEVEEPLTRAAALDSGFKEVFNLRGVSRFKAKRYEEAACDFKAALEIDSGSAPDLANLGLCEKFLGNREAAVDYLNTALHMDPSLDWAMPHLEELLEDE